MFSRRHPTTRLRSPRDRYGRPSVETGAFVGQRPQFAVVRRGEEPGQQISAPLGNRQSERQTARKLIALDAERHRALEEEECNAVLGEDFAFAHVVDDGMSKGELAAENP